MLGIIIDLSSQGLWNAGNDQEVIQVRILFSFLLEKPLATGFIMFVKTREAQICPNKRQWEWQRLALPVELQKPLVTRIHWN